MNLFADVNKELSLSEYTKKLKEEMPELDHLHKIIMLKTLKTIKNILVFFVVLIILSMAIYLISEIIQFVNNGNPQYRY
jgi:hypothetical protein